MFLSPNFSISSVMKWFCLHFLSPKSCWYPKRWRDLVFFLFTEKMSVSAAMTCYFDRFLSPKSCDARSDEVILFAPSFHWNAVGICFPAHGWLQWLCFMQASCWTGSISRTTKARDLLDQQSPRMVLSLTLGAPHHRRPRLLRRSFPAPGATSSAATPAHVSALAVSDEVQAMLECFNVSRHIPRLPYQDLRRRTELPNGTAEWQQHWNWVWYHTQSPVICALI